MMDEVLKNASLFLKILGMSKTSMIQQWDSEAFQRALKWARYFEQVYVKLNKKESLKQRLEHHLMQLSSENILAMGCQIIHFEDLREAQEILKRNILQNSWCTQEVYAEVLRCCYLVDDGTQLVSEKLTEDLIGILQVHCSCLAAKDIGKKLLKHKLGNATEMQLQEYGKFCECKKTTSLAERVAEEAFSIRVKSRLLRERVIQYLEKNDDLTDLNCKMDKVTLHSKGQIILLEAYLANFQLSGNEKNTESFSKKFSSFAIGYIQGNLLSRWKDDIERFLDLPSSKLAEVAATCEIFAKIYFELLHLCCQTYDQDLGQEALYLVKQRPEELRPTRQKMQESWLKTLKNHFKELHNQGMLDNVNFNRMNKTVKLGLYPKENPIIGCIWDQMIDMFEC